MINIQPSGENQSITDIDGEAAPHSVLSPSVQKAIADAQQGDRQAWAVLYAAAAAYVAGGSPVPVGIREIIAQRLQALSDALHGTSDARAKLLDAAAPMPAGKFRVVGAKRKSMTIEDAARAVLWYQEYMGVSLKAASRKIESLDLDPKTQKPLYKASSLEAAAKSINKRQRDAEKQQPT